MPYRLAFAAGTSKPAIIINSAQIDSTSTSMILYGKGFPNYGEGVQTNLLRLLENWASPTSPPHPTAGQLWYDTGVNALKVFNGSFFVNTTVTAGTIQPPNPTVGELWFNPSASILYLYDGTQFVSLFATNSVSGLNAKLDKTGGTLSGSLYLASDPILPFEAVTKHYVDTLFTQITVINDATTFRNLTLSDKHSYIRMNSSTANTVQVPNTIAVNFPIGTEIRIKQVNIGQTTIMGSSGVTLLAASSTSLAGAGAIATLIKIGTNVWDVFGDLA